MRGLQYLVIQVKVTKVNQIKSLGRDHGLMHSRPFPKTHTRQDSGAGHLSVGSLRPVFRIPLIIPLRSAARSADHHAPVPLLSRGEHTRRLSLRNQLSSFVIPLLASSFPHSARPFRSHSALVPLLSRGEHTRRDSDAGRAQSTDDELLRVIVQVKTSDVPAHSSGHHPPPELIVLPKNGTVARLKVGWAVLLRLFHCRFFGRLLFKENPWIVVFHS